MATWNAKMRVNERHQAGRKLRQQEYGWPASSSGWSIYVSLP